MEKLPPAPSISRGFLEHRGRGRILPGGPPGSARPPLGICHVCPGLAAWPRADLCVNWGGNLEKKMLRASHPHGAEQRCLPGRGAAARELGQPRRAGSEALGSSLPKLGKEKGHPASSTLPSGYLYAAGMGAGRRGRGGWSGA